MVAPLLRSRGIRFAYRRFGKPGGIPLVFNQHYIGTMDYWDPAFVTTLSMRAAELCFGGRLGALAAQYGSQRATSG